LSSLSFLLLNNFRLSSITLSLLRSLEVSFE